VIAAASVVACVSHQITREVDTAPKIRDAGELGIETPHLEGPDQLDLAPLIAVNSAGFSFDREPIARNGLEPRLRTYRANFAVLHPGEPVPREVLLACSPSVSSDEIFSVLDTAWHLGFDRARLVFEDARTRPSSQVEERPHKLSAARVSLMAGVESDTPYIRSSQVQSCADLCERVVNLRRQGQTVTVAVRAAR